MAWSRKKLRVDKTSSLDFCIIIAPCECNFFEAFLYDEHERNNENYSQQSEAIGNFENVYTRTCTKAKGKSIGHYTHTAYSKQQDIDIKIKCMSE